MSNDDVVQLSRMYQYSEINGNGHLAEREYGKQLKMIMKMMTITIVLMSKNHAFWEVKINIGRYFEYH